MPALLSFTRLQFHNRPVSPPILSLGEFLHGSEQLRLIFRRHDTRSGREALAGNSQRHVRRDLQVLQPVGGSVFRDDVKAPSALGKPDLDLTRTAGLASPRCQVEILFAVEATSL